MPHSSKCIAAWNATRAADVPGSAAKMIFFVVVVTAASSAFSTRSWRLSAARVAPTTTAANRASSSSFSFSFSFPPPPPPQSPPLSPSSSFEHGIRPEGRWTPITGTRAVSAIADQCSTSLTRSWTSTITVSRRRVASRRFFWFWFFGVERRQLALKGVEDGD
eukprot:3122-Pelagococcus_subviridis.AAC.1